MMECLILVFSLFAGVFSLSAFAEDEDVNAALEDPNYGSEKSGYVGEDGEYVESAIDLASEEDEDLEPLEDDEEELKLYEGIDDLSDVEIYSEKGIINILLLGLDYRNDWNTSRADTNMIFSFNTNTGEIKIISIERGVAFRVTETLWQPRYRILTNVYRTGGGELSQKVIMRDLQVDLAGYVSVYFKGFREIVNAIGGVDIELTEKEAAALNKEIATNAWTENHMEPGMNHMTGADALAYCRLRFIDDDFRRMERQQKTVQACLDSVRKLSMKQVKEVIELVMDNIKTNIPAGDLLKLAAKANKFLENPTVEKMTVPVEQPGWYTKKSIDCDFNLESQRIKEFIYGVSSD